MDWSEGDQRLGQASHLNTLSLCSKENKKQTKPSTHMINNSFYVQDILIELFSNIPTRLNVTL